MIPPYLSPLVTHLWQSTLFAVVTALLVTMLRRNKAAVRYWLWLAASLKFLFPFSWLIAFASQFSSRTISLIQSDAWPITVEHVLTPPIFSAAAPTVTPIVSATTLGPILVFAPWICGLAVVLFSWWREWQPLRAAMRRATPLAIGTRGNVELVAMSSSDLLEPGLVGIWRPVLLLPDGITNRLTPSQLDAIVAHELCHARRRDNLAAATHMVVEALFWFHPLVWWLENRLVEERERACDEGVLRDTEPQVYAEAILSVCRHYIESRLVCAAGVTGANLRKRVEEIVRNTPGQSLGARKKLLLTATAIAMVGAPVTVGVLKAPLLAAQSLAIPSPPAEALAFEAASIKPNESTDRSRGAGFQPGGRFLARAMPLRSLVGIAYGTPQPLPNFRVLGGPSWVDVDGFDIEAKTVGNFPDTQGGPGFSNSGELMLRTLLAERFNLVVHTEPRDLPIYTLVLARSDGRLGPQVHRSDVDCDAVAAARLARGAASPPTPSQQTDRPVCAFRGLTGGSVTISQFAAVLSPIVQRVVVDRTSLPGRFDIDFSTTPEQMRLPAAATGLAASDTPSVFTAMQEQLGLKLDSQRGPVDVVVIDRAEHPSSN